MLFLQMDMKLMMIDLHHLRTNQLIEVILAVQYINMYGSVMVYIIGGQEFVDDMHKNLIKLSKNSSVYLLKSQHFLLLN